VPCSRAFLGVDPLRVDRLGAPAHEYGFGFLQPCAYHRAETLARPDLAVEPGIDAKGGQMLRDGQDKGARLLRVGNEDFRHGPCPPNGATVEPDS
jgi:hypothetical protein